MRRRTALAGGGSLLVGLLAGCLGASVGPGGTETDRTVTPDLEPTFSVESRGCGQGTDRASVEFETGSVRVDGVIGGSNTCESAALESVAMADGTLRVIVATVMPETGTPACGQCLTDINYHLQVAYDGPAPETVVVVHDETVVRRVAGPGDA